MAGEKKSKLKAKQRNATTSNIPHIPDIPAPDDFYAPPDVDINNLMDGMVNPGSLSYNSDQQERIEELEQENQELSEKLNNSIVIKSDSESEGWELTETGFRFIGELTREQWEDAYEILRTYNSAVQWFWGDLLAAAEDLKYGEIPIIAQDIGIAKQTLYDWISVSRNMQISLRKEVLSFSHHKVVAHMCDTDGDKEKWLNAAVQGDDGKLWSVRRLREEILNDREDDEAEETTIVKSKEPLSVYGQDFKMLTKILKKAQKGKKFTREEYTIMEHILRQMAENMVQQENDASDNQA